MTTPQDRQPGAQAPPVSPRVRLAQLAHAAALRVPGVVAPDSGPMRLFLTAGGNERVDGVRCVAVGEGYDVSLRLNCELVRLPALGDAVRLSVLHAARAAHLNVGEVNVLIADVVQSGGTS